MALSYVLKQTPLSPSPTPLRVLVTGAAGNIGSYFAAHSHQRYKLTLMILGKEKPERIEALKNFGEVVIADLSDLERLKQICQGIDVVVHLAGNPSPYAVWDDVLRANIVGTYNLFVAALAAGCRRIVFASSIHAVSGYPVDCQVKTNEPVNPGDIYGVSKCFGEALARYMAEQEGISTICLRIGAFQSPAKAETPKGLAAMNAFVSDRDLNQLIERSIDDLRLQFAVFHGISDNFFKRLDIDDTRELLGYRPQDDVTEMHPDLGRLHLRFAVSGHTVRTDNQPSGLRNQLKDKTE